MPWPVSFNNFSQWQLKCHSPRQTFLSRPTQHKCPSSLSASINAPLLSLSQLKITYFFACFV